MKKAILTASLLLWIVLFAFSQSSIPKSPHASLTTVTHIDQKTGLPSFIHFDDKVPFDQLNVWLNQNYGVEQDMTYSPIRTEKDKLGGIHYVYKQQYRNIPVHDAVFIVHTKNNLIESINGTIYRDISLTNDTDMSKKACLEKALEHVGAETYMWEIDEEEQLLQSIKNNPQVSYFPEGELEIIPQNGMHRLCYRFDIYSKQPLARAEYYIDAATGKIAYENPILVNTDVPGTAETKYSGTRNITTDSYSGSYRLRESGRGLGIETYDMNEGTSYTSAVDFVDDDNYWNNYNSSLDEVATDAHWATEMTYDFYYNTFDRNSIDDAGFKLMSYVHYDNSFVNAFWDGYRMTYGDGSGSVMPLVCVDIVAHEITHGLTSYTANLDYSNESGALNEAFSDIFGSMVEHYAKPESANWTVGEDINFTIRSLENPNLYELPDTYMGVYWYTGSGDYGGVHTNNGVLSYWFYLIAEGGTGTNDNGDTYSIDPIGIDNAAAIAYRMLTVYLTNTSEYADARTYAIQSAIDLFGNCSFELQQVTNAMYAVGIGESFDNLINADFSADVTFSCSSPLEVAFTNNTQNSTEYFWDFGDGNTSTEENPVHTYTSPGSYTVTLIASGDVLCEGEDTLIMEDYITVSDGGGPAPPECAPEAEIVNTSTNIGIHNFTFNTINHDSEQAAVEGYQDLSCLYQTTLTEGHFYDVSVETGSSYNEYVKIWIDFNGNGQFNNADELVFEADAEVQFHTGTIEIPECEVFDSALRMRVGSDYNEFTDACQSLNYGQYEDYSVIIQENTMPPAEDFTASSLVASTGAEINFLDLTQNLPDTWSWNFPGATPETSSDQNPVVTYDSVGVYSVSLLAENEHGSDSLVKSDFITISNIFNLCSDNNSTSALSGVLYDSGGPDVNYGYNEYCTFLIDPGCAQSITMSFNSLDIEPYGNDDYLRVYDGVDESGTLLLEAYGDNIPEAVTATSGSMFITFNSDSYSNYAGFEALWNTVIPDTAPVADFSVSSTNPACNTEIQFTDLSSEFINQWYWDFGDGVTSLLQNPTHVYDSPGTKTVTLVVDNCYSQDTAVFTIEVQDTAIIELIPSELNIEYTGCADSICQEISIVNNGMGDLIVNFEQSGNSPANILALTYGVDYDQEYQHTLAAINQYYTDYDLSEINTISSEELEIALVDKDVLLIPEIETGSDAVFTGFSGVLQEYVANGGNVVFCGTNHEGSVSGTGLLDAEFMGDFYSPYTLTVLDNMHPITQGVSETIESPNATFRYSFNNSDMHNLVEYSDNTIVGYREPGQGKVVFIGFDYYAYSDETARILANTMEWCAYNPVSINEESDTVPPSDTLIANLCIQTSSYTSGLYADTIYIASNDPTNSNLALPYSLNLTGLPEVSPQDTSLSFGTLLQGEYTSDSLIIRNSGCDTLFITSLFTSDPTFSVDMSSLTLAPFSEDTLEISFNPDAIQVYDDTLYIQNNDTDTLIALHGEGVPAPEISLEPDSIYASLNACNDSITIPLTIYNVGGSDLEINIPGTTNGGGGKNVLTLTYGVDYGDEYTKMLEAINQFYTDYELSEVNTTNADVLQDSLENKDVFIIPEQVTGSYGVFTGFADVLQQYVETGGNVIFCGTGSEECIFNTGLLAGTYNGLISYGELNVQDTTHFITDGVGTTVDAMSATFYYTLTNPDIISLLEYNDQHVVAVRELSYGKVILMGFDFYEYNDDIARLMANAVENVMGVPEWLHLSSNQDTIPAMDSTVVNVTLRAEDLVSGFYSDSIMIETNDPLNPSLTVPIDLIINGSPEIIPMNTSMNFQTTMIGTQETDSLIIKNTGCDNLNITGFSTSDPAYSVDLSGMIIPPFSQDTLKITFSPDAYQIYDDTLFIQNNDTDTTVMLYGVGIPAPEIAVDPDSVYINVNPCYNEMLTIPVTIQNTGDADLNTAHELYSGTSGGTLQLLALTYGVDLDDEYVNTIEAIDQYFTDYNLSEVNTTDPLVLQDSLNGKHALLIPELESGDASVISGFADVLQEYVENGGDVIICGTSRLNNIFATGLLDGDYYSGISGETELNVLNTTHPLTNGIGTSITAQNGTYVYDFSNPSFECLVDYGGHDVVGYREMGEGSVSYIGFDYYDYSDETARILANACQSVDLGYEDILLNVSPDSLTIGGGFSDELELTLDPSGLVPGTYYDQLIISSNDPSNPEIVIPCVVNVSDQLCADFSYNLQSACSGEIHFTDQSLNAPTIWQWDFGDGNCSDLQNPVHTYVEPGDYTVQLIVQNGMHSDTISQVISLNNISGPIVTSCVPGSYPDLADYGINGFSLNQISNFTGNISDTSGYSDFTCDYSTNLVVSEEYELYIEMVEGYTYDVWAWIDFNNNATFESNELVLNAQSVGYVVNAPVTVPEDQVMNTPLRMRVCCDLESSNEPGPCGQVFYGEYEDYTVTLEQNVAPPVADFTYTELDACQGIFHFEDESNYMPQDWFWDIGDGTTSSYQNPYHTFALAGSYNVTLSVSNEQGDDQVSKTINVHALNPEIQHSGELAVNQPIEFSPNSLNVSEYNWDFGDGDFSNQPEPVHIYTETGSYMVTLDVISYFGCEATAYKMLDVSEENSNGDLQAEQQVQIYPNPADEQLFVECPLATDLNLSVLTVNGKEVMHHVLTDDVSRINIQSLSPGLYILKFSNDKISIRKKLTVM